MTLEYPLVDVKDTSSIDSPVGPELRLPISGKVGSTTSAFHLTVQANEKTTYHRTNGCSEISVLLSGRGTIFIGQQIFEVHAGHCIHIPLGIAHQFHNTSDQPAEIVGFYIGAGELTDAAFEESNTPQMATFDNPPVVHWDDVIPENMNKKEGWHINDFRLPFGLHNGCTTTLFRALFFPGAIHKKHAHENCEEIYYLISGHGLAGAGDDRVEISAGQFHYIPAGVEHWLYNLSQTDPIHVIGIYIGSGSVSDTGYVFLGDVTSDDIEARTNLEQ